MVNHQYWKNLDNFDQYMTENEKQRPYWWPKYFTRKLQERTPIRVQLVHTGDFDEDVLFFLSWLPLNGWGRYHLSPSLYPRAKEFVYDRIRRTVAGTLFPPAAAQWGLTIVKTPCRRNPKVILYIESRFYKEALEDFFDELDRETTEAESPDSDYYC